MHLCPLPFWLVPAAAAACSPVGMGAVLQPMPTVQVETDAAGNIKFSGAALSRQQWQAMAKASGWTDGMCREGC